MQAVNNYIIVETIKTEPKKIAGLIMTEELDSGTIIIQGEVPIHKKDTIDTLTKRIQRKEYALLPAAIQQIKESL